MTVKYFLFFFFFQYSFPTSSLLGDVVFSSRNEYFSGYREQKSVSFAHSQIWLWQRMINTVEIYIKKPMWSKRTSFGHVQPSLKISSFPLLSCFSRILPFLEVHWEEAIWNIRQWEEETVVSLQWSKPFSTVMKKFTFVFVVQRKTLPKHHLCPKRQNIDNYQKELLKELMIFLQTEL